MSSLELCPLSEHLEEAEIESLVAELEDAEVENIEFDDDVDPVPVEQNYDEDVFVDFWDQVEANDVACDIYLPFEFEDVLEVGGRRYGSAHALLIVLANIKEDMFLGDDEDEEEEDESIEDIDDELDEFDDYGAEDEHFDGEEENPIEVKDEQMRRVWRALNKAARHCIGQQLALFIHNN